MSYVLDALKKADAERERGAVPGLHAQPMPGLMDEARPTRALPAWVWLLAGAAAVLLVALVWLLSARSQPAPAPASPASPLPPPALSEAPTPTAPPHAPAPGNMAVLPRTEPPLPRPAATAARRTAEPALAPVAVTAATVPSSSPEPRPLAARPSPAPKPAEPTQTAATPASPPAAPKADAGAEGRILALSELPDDVRRALPRLSVGGSIYSDNPASRFVIINGQVFHENDKLAPDLTLEQIQLKLAVLRYKDLRFRIMF